MAIALYFAAFLAVAVGAAHSYLGERYIISRLLRRDNLPKLFGSDAFTRQTLRFAWHLTTIAWWGFAAILALMAFDAFSRENTALVLALTFLASAILTAAYTRGRHLAWVVFLLIAVIAAAAYAAGTGA